MKGSALTSLQPLQCISQVYVVSTYRFTLKMHMNVSQKKGRYQNNIFNIQETGIFGLFVQSLFVLMFMCVTTQSLITYSGFYHRSHAMLRCRLHSMHRVSSYSVLFSALFQCISSGLTCCTLCSGHSHLFLDTSNPFQSMEQDEEGGLSIG